MDSILGDSINSVVVELIGLVSIEESDCGVVSFSSGTLVSTGKCQRPHSEGRDVGSVVKLSRGVQAAG